jgi:hypothetical protein
MSQSASNLLTALRELRRSIMLEAAGRVQGWHSDIGQPRRSPRCAA